MPLSQVSVIHYLIHFIAFVNRLVNFSKALLVGLLSVGSASAARQGSAAPFPCGNCKCGDNGQYHIDDFRGASGCRPLDSSIRAMGLTGFAGKLNPKTTCAIYSDPGCQNQVQSMGVDWNDTWGCTAFNQDAQSIQCWFAT